MIARFNAQEGPNMARKLKCLHANGSDNRHKATAKKRKRWKGK